MTWKGSPNASWRKASNYSNQFIQKGSMAPRNKHATTCFELELHKKVPIGIYKTFQWTLASEKTFRHTRLLNRTWTGILHADIINDQTRFGTLHQSLESTLGKILTHYEKTIVEIDLHTYICKIINSYICNCTIMEINLQRKTIASLLQVFSIYDSPNDVNTKTDHKNTIHTIMTYVWKLSI